MKDTNTLLKEATERKIGDLMVDQLLITQQISQMTRVKLMNPTKLHEVEAQEKQLSRLATQTSNTCSLLQEVYANICKDMGEEVILPKSEEKTEVKVEVKEDNKNEPKEVIQEVEVVASEVPEATPKVELVTK